MTYKAGIVKSVAGANAVVEFPDLDGMTTKPIPVGQASTGKDKAFRMPKPGDHVGVVMDENFEDGLVVAAIYSDADPPPVTGDRIHLALEGGAVFDFDAEAQSLNISIGGCTFTLSSTGLSVDGGKIIVAGGNIETDQDVIADTVSLRFHLTQDVQSGTGLSGIPKP